MTKLTIMAGRLAWGGLGLGENVAAAIGAPATQGPTHPATQSLLKYSMVSSVGSARQDDWTRWDRDTSLQWHMSFGEQVRCMSCKLLGWKESGAPRICLHIGFFCWMPPCPGSGVLREESVMSLDHFPLFLHSPSARGCAV